MEPAHSHQEENDLLRAHLLIQHGKRQEALDLIHRLEAQGASRPDLDALRREIESAAAAEKAKAHSQRDARYYLGLQTTTARIWWCVAAAAALFYSLWNGALTLRRGAVHGFTADITTQIYARDGTYPFTHPVYLDLVYCVALFLAAVWAIATVIRVSRGANPWEELDTTSDHSQFTWRIWP